MAFLVLGLAISVGFQNCAGYEALNSPLYDQASVDTCTGIACGMDTSLIKISIANDAAVSVRKVASMSPSCIGNDDRCIDIGGYCDDGGFPVTQIWAQIYGGTVNQEAYLTGASCVDGRYSVQIPLPAGYDYDNIHTLRLTLYGLTSTSSDRFTNETGGNYREVNIVAYTPN